MCVTTFLGNSSILDNNVFYDIYRKWHAGLMRRRMALYIQPRFHITNMLIEQALKNPIAFVYMVPV